MKRTHALAAALFALNAWLYWPLFLPGEYPYRGSIEAGYAAMARFIAAHPDPWGWNPMQYCGLPTQFTYLPGLVYLSASWIRLLPHADPVWVHRAVSGVFACAAPAAVFWFVLRRAQSLQWAFAAGFVYTVFSPLYGLLSVVEKDRGAVDLPWRLQVLVKYGEGPHTAGLVLLLLAVGAVWAAAEGKTYRSLLVAAVALAAVPLTNWIAALALAFCCAMLLLTFAGSQGFDWKRVLAAGLLGYGLAAFWLTPSFVSTIGFNWPADSFGYRLESSQKWLLAGLAAGLALIRVPFGRKCSRPYLCFLSLSTFLFGFIVFFYDSYRLDTIPESRRYTLEFELFLVLFLCELLRLVTGARDTAVRRAAWISAALAVAAGVPQAWDRFEQKYSEWGLRPREQTVEYRIAKWLDERRPSGRILASGGVRYRLNAWFDLPQVGGTFETGLRNRVPLDLAYELRSDAGPRERIPDKLKALDVEYVVVHGPASEEHYRDFKNPGRFDAILERVWAEKDDVIYRVPGYSPRLDWQGAGVVRVRTGEVPVNYDPGWRALAGGRPAGVAATAQGFIRLAEAEKTPAELRYHGTMEQKAMAAISAVVWLLALAALRKYP